MNKKDAQSPRTRIAGPDATAREAGVAAPPPRRPPPGWLPFDRLIDSPADAQTPEDADDSRRGQVEYRIESHIARGGMGDVFLARHLPTGRRVALKTPRPGLSPDYAVDLLWEARATTGLEHPGVIPVHDIGIARSAAPPEHQTPAFPSAYGADDAPPSAPLSGQPFYAMRRLPDGNTWNERIRELSIEENIHILLRVADVVRYAHSRGVVHRDLKPANVMLGHFGEVFVLDWGLAVHVAGVNADGAGEADADSPGDASREEVFARPLDPGHGPGASVGTPSYAPPESARGEIARTGPSTDIYLLGAILYEIISGEPPHGRGDPQKALRRAATNHIDWDRVPPAHRELRLIARRATRTVAARRYADADAFQRALGDWLRRREAMALYERAKEGLRRARSRAAAGQSAEAYVEFERTNGLADAVAELSPGYPPLAAFRRSLARAHAAFALSRDDLALAEARLPDAEANDSETEELRAAVVARQALRRRRKRRARQFRWLLAASVASLALAFYWAAREAHRANAALWNLSNRLYAAGADARGGGRPDEARRNFHEAGTLFRQLGRDYAPVRVSLADLDDTQAPFHSLPRFTEADTAGKKHDVQTWAFLSSSSSVHPGTAVALTDDGLALARSLDSGEILWRCDGAASMPAASGFPAAAAGRWTISPDGGKALFAAVGASLFFSWVDLSRGRVLGHGALEGDYPVSNMRFAVADDASRWLACGNDSSGTWRNLMVERVDGSWTATPLRFAPRLDAALFLDENRVFLSAPGDGDATGRHLIVARRAEGWRLESAFARLAGQGVDRVFLSPDKRRLTVVYAPPPSLPPDGAAVPAGLGAALSPAFAVRTEEWILGQKPRRSGAGRHFPASREIAYGRWLDWRLDPEGRPRDLLFAANSLNGMARLWRLSADGSAFRAARTLFLSDSQSQSPDADAHIVAGRVTPRADGNDRFVLGLSDGALVVFEAERPEKDRVVELPDFARGGEDGAATAIASFDGDIPGVFIVHGKNAALVDPSDEGKTLRIHFPDADAGRDSVSDVFDAGRREERTLLAFVTGEPRARPRPALALARRDGHPVAAYAHGGTVLLWEGRDGPVFQSLPPLRKAVRALHFGARGEPLAYAADGIHIRENDAWRRRHALACPEGYVPLPHPALFSPDGRRLVRMLVAPSADLPLVLRSPDAGPRTMLEVWDVVDGRRLWSKDGWIATAAAWSDDGQTLAVGLARGEGMRLCRGQDGKELPAPSVQVGHTPARLAFSPDGKYLASTGASGDLRVWHTGEWLECLNRPALRFRDSSGTPGSGPPTAKAGYEDVLFTAKDGLLSFTSDASGGVGGGGGLSPSDHATAPRSSATGDLIIFGALRFH